MAADILIHRPAKVPVGKDQEQHLEITRTLARRFNRLYETEVFPEPAAFNFGSELVKIPGLDGSGKMGKSEGNGIFLADDEKTIHKKVMRAVTDSGPTAPHSDMSEPMQHIFTLLQVVSTPDVVTHFRAAYDNCTIRYGELKKQLADDTCKVTLPIRARIQDIGANADYLRKVAQRGAARARESAQTTLKEVRRAVGIKGF
jgi:tryptophanyl-tRNA synthetase